MIELCDIYGFLNSVIACSLKWWPNNYLVVVQRASYYFPHYWKIALLWNGYGDYGYFYNKSIHNMLHFVCGNQKFPLYVHPMYHWLLDVVIENIQKFYNQMNFEIIGKGGWNDLCMLCQWSSYSAFHKKGYCRVQNKSEK